MVRSPNAPTVGLVSIPHVPFGGRETFDEHCHSETCHRFQEHCLVV
jgi:hypothetical protein